MKTMLASILLLSVTANVVAMELHVAPTGNDSGAGTSAHPFATPTRAMAAVRALVADGLKDDVRVVFHAGTYTLTAPLVFTAADSGSERHSVTYAAAAGEPVILSGGRPITGWKRAAGAKWTAQLPDVKAGKWFFRQLVVDDRRAVRARWPNDDGTLHVATVGNGVKTFTFDRALPRESLGGQDAELVVYQNWSVSRALVETWNEKQLTTATAVGWMGHGDFTTASPGKAAFIENARSAVDQPGEWFLDRGAGVLTYLATNEAEPSSAVAPFLTKLLKIAGTKDQPVRNLRFEGLRFEHTDFPLPAAGYSEIQAAHFGPAVNEPSHVQPVAIECSFAEGVRFERCRLAHLNNSGIGFGPGCRQNSVSGCQIEDIGGAGVMIGWRGVGKLQPGAEGTLDADWADPTDAPVSNEISNCIIRRCGADSCGAPAVFVAFSTDTRVAHNHIYDLPYTGISIGYRWNTTPTSQVRCVAEYNHIHDVMKKLADGGGIYTLGFQPGTVLRGNLIHDVHRSAYAHGGAPNNGFFIDEGSKGFHFEANVVHATSGDSVRFNQTNQESHTWKENAFDAAATPAVIEAARQRAGIQPAFINAATPRTRRVLYNFDGDSCLSTKAGGKGPVPVNIDDVKRLIEEVAYEGSRVDTVLVCVNAQVMYYPTKVGTMRGTLSTAEERAKWPASEKQRFENLKAFFDSGVDPYAVMLAEAKRRGREALLTFRMNDDHGNDFLRTQFQVDHPEWRLGTEQYRGKGALDFGRDEARDYTFRLIEEAVRRYDCDGIELDFNRFPTFFKDGTTEERVTKMNSLVERVRKMLDGVGRERGRRLVLSVRPPSNGGNSPPTPESARQRGCDVPAWIKNGWVDFVAISEFLLERGDLPIEKWKQAMTTVPVYGGIECTRNYGQKNLTADEYRAAATQLLKKKVDGIYLFNFFTSREEGEKAYEPPFEILRDLNQ